VRERVRETYFAPLGPVQPAKILGSDPQSQSFTVSQGGWAGGEGGGGGGGGGGGDSGSDVDAGGGGDSDVDEGGSGGSGVDRGGSEVDVEGEGDNSDVEGRGADTEVDGTGSGSAEAGAVDSTVVAVVLEGATELATVDVRGSISRSSSAEEKSLGSQPGT
jgi:hypothetical protein